ncbi:MAG: response regulator, partial [Candidatus Rifleibacteriota bacterium]
GLGLPTVLGIVRRHHGAIMVKSEIGAGSEFTLMFPCKDTGKDETEVVVSQVPDKFPAGAVLVVDDEEAVSEILCMQLNNLGFATHQAFDGNAGLTMFKQLNQDLSLVIVDLAMPGKSGMDLIRELRWLNPEIPVIVCSGMTESMEDLSPLGVNITLRKPFRLADIEQALLKVQFKK